MAKTKEPVKVKPIEYKPNKTVKEVPIQNKPIKDHSAMLYKNHTIYCSTPDCSCYPVCRNKYDSFWAVRCNQNVNNQLNQK